MSVAPSVFSGSRDYRAPKPGPVVTIGNFDGVHVGHRALLARARELAGPEGRVCALTFDPSPREVLRPASRLPSLQTVADRVQTLLDAGADHVVVEPFDHAYSRQTAEGWARSVLIGRLRATALVVGWDFRFGRGRSGGVEALREVLPGPVEQVGGVQVDGEVVSSTRIRKAVLAGEVRLAARWLARPHDVWGQVVAGDGRGRSLGVPTANVDLSGGLPPAAGVYAVQAQVGGRWRAGVANLGDRPTFGPTQGRLEVHLIDGESVPDLRGVRVRVRFWQRLRSERRFESAEQLVAQIQEDILAARGALERVP